MGVEGDTVREEGGDVRRVQLGVGRARAGLEGVPHLPLSVNEPACGRFGALHVARRRWGRYVDCDVRLLLPVASLGLVEELLPALDLRGHGGFLSSDCFDCEIDSKI